MNALTIDTGFQNDTDGWARLFDAIDRRDARAFTRFLTPDASFHFGNAPPVVGAEAIEAAVAGFFAMLGGCRHQLRASWGDRDSAVCEGEVTYTTPSGTTVTVPFANVFDLRGDAIASYRIYIDNGPLFAALAPVAPAATVGD